MGCITSKWGMGSLNDRNAAFPVGPTRIGPHRPVRSCLEYIIHNKRGALRGVPLFVDLYEHLSEQTGEEREFSLRVISKLTLQTNTADSRSPPSPSAHSRRPPRRCCWRSRDGRQRAPKHGATYFRGGSSQPISAASAWSMSFCSVSACFFSVMAPTMGSPTMLPFRSTT